VEANTADIVAKVREVLGAQPDTHTKTSLAEAVGGRKQDALTVIAQLQADGVVIPNQPRAKLRLATSESKANVALDTEANALSWKAALNPESSGDGSL
jgi:hypothetical protein